MPVIIASKEKVQGYIKIHALNTDVVVYESRGASDDYLVEGYIDLREMSSEDTVTICEYIAVDGVVESPFLCVTFKGKQEEPVLRFHTKTLLSNMIYKVVIKQLYGYLIGIYYGFIKEVMGIT